jgi:uncharacterized protein (DUF1015 family)
MSLIRPLKALRPSVKHVSQVASVPYDVLNAAEAKELAHGNPLSFLHVSRPEIDCPAGTAPYSDEIYRRAAINFQKLIQACPLVREEGESLYIYQLEMGEHRQTGLFGTFSIDEYDSDLIKKHERTRPEKEDDRTRHILELSAQTGPVFLTYKEVPGIDEAVEKIKSLAPLYHFVAPDKITHTLWIVPQPDLFVSLFAKHVSALYIADGHHRAAAASRVRQVLSKQNLQHTGQEDYNFVLAVAFPDQQLKIFPYYRMVKDLNGLTESEFLRKIETSFKVSAEKRFEPHRHEFGMYLQGQWYRLMPLPKAELDVSLLQDHLLGPILGIADPRTDQRIEFVGGIRGLGELENAVNQGRAAVAFSLHPTSVDDVMQTSDRGMIMPPKSTWFEPKLRDGLLCHYWGK